MAGRFSFVTDKAVEKVRSDRVPINTTKHTTWSTNVYKAWVKGRNKQFKDFEVWSKKFKSIPSLESISLEEINYWLSKFAVEVRKKDGTDYRHEVLYSLFCGINRTIEDNKPEISLFRTAQLKPFQNTLDGRLKELQAAQQPYRKRADALSVSDEAKMWEQGILGTESPDTVINTLLFLSGKLFSLRGGQEQRDLSHNQFKFIEEDDGSMLVKYAEKVSKTNQGGLKRRKKELKEVEHVEDPLDDKSFTFIYNFYLSKCPKDVGDLFYLKPKQKWNCGSEIWFESRPIGKNTLDQRVKQMCSEARMEGNYSNHSLRATAITRMYEAGLSEKQIMKRSGHRSVEGVRTYQRENPKEKREVSDVLATSRHVCEQPTTLVDDVEDDILAKALSEYENSVKPTINLSGFLQGATANNVTINVNINK